MSNETYNSALRNSLSEIKKICPDITTTLIFKENGEILAKDQDTTQGAANSTREALNAITEKASVIGGIESATFQGADATINISHSDEFYITNVYSKEADEKIVSNLTHVLIPTMLKLVREICPSPKNQFMETVQKPKPEISTPYEPTIPKPKETQLTVESLSGLGGLRRDQEEVRIDRALIAQWREQFGQNLAEKITLANPANGKSLQCEFTTIKESKNEDKGIIQLSEKVKLALDVQKGTRVLAKPVIKNQEDNAATASNKDISEPEETTSKSKLTAQKIFDTYISNSQAGQFIVENFKGAGNIFGNSDIVQVDRAIIARWKEQFGEKDINKVMVEETATGKKISSKFQPIKDSNLEGKGIIQIPEKIQRALQTKKGALVIIKPIVEQTEQ